MTFQEMEDVITATGLMMQTLLHTAFMVEECETLGGNSCLSCGTGGSGDQTHTLDQAYSLTRHVRNETEKRKLVKWTGTVTVEPELWPRVVIAFWFRVPKRAALDIQGLAKRNHT